MTDRRRTPLPPALWVISLLPLLASCGGSLPTPDTASAEATGRRFTALLAELERSAADTAASLASVTGGLDSPDSFADLGRRRRKLLESRPGEPALSVWSAAGRPLCWAGSAHQPPEPPPSRGAGFTARATGGRVQLLSWVEGSEGTSVVAERSFGLESTWNPARIVRPGEAGFQVQYFDAGPFPAPPAVVAPTHVLQAPDGRRLGHLIAVGSGEPSGRRPGLGAAGLWTLWFAVALSLAIWHRRHLQGEPFGMRQLLVLSAGVWGLRGALLALPLEALAGGSTSLTEATLFASASYFGLFRSPLDALLTGLACTLQAGAVLRMLHAGWGRLRHRQVAAIAAALFLAAALQFVTQTAENSPLNLVSTAAAPHGGIRTVLQSGLFLLLWAPLLVLLGCWKAALQPLWRAAAAVPVATLMLFLCLTISSQQAQQQWITQNLRPRFLSHETDRIHVLADSIRNLEENPELAALAVAGDGADALAYRLWMRTELARQGYRSSLELYGPDGSLRGHFGARMPPPVPAARPLNNLSPVRAEIIRFSTLSQEEEVLVSRIPVRRNDTIVGSVALLVSNEVDNLPAMLPPRPTWMATVPGFASAAASDLLEGNPLVVVYDSGSRLRWSSHPGPPPLLAGFTTRTVTSTGVWHDAESRGHNVRLLYFSDGHLLYGIGTHGSSLIDHLDRLLEMLLLLAGVALAVWGLPLLLLVPARLATALAAWTRIFWMSYSLKLVAGALVASLVPLLILAAVARTSLERQRQETLLNQGLQTLGVAERVVMDAVSAAAEDGSPSIIPTDETLFWLSRITRQEIDLFVGGLLAATSRRGLYAAGILSSLPDAELHRQVVLGGSQATLIMQAGNPSSAATINGPLDIERRRPAILSLPLDLQEEEVERRLAEVRQSIDLATAAVAALLVGGSILLGRGMSARLRRLTMATERLAAGEERVEVMLETGDEIGRLTGSFNAMATTLAEQREALRRRTAMLEKVLLHAPTGIVSLDGQGLVVMSNPSAQRILQVPEPLAPGERLEQVLRGSPYGSGVLDLLSRPPQPGAPSQDELEPEGGGEERLRAILAELPGTVPGSLLVLEDVTESVRSNRLAAWADMARRIAHEVKNPLTPIRLSAEHLRRVHERGDADLDRTLVQTIETILTQVEALREIASDFSLYARIPAISRRPVPVSPLLNEILAPYAAAPPAGVRIVQDVPDDLPVVSLDKGLLRRALINLLENALQAMPDGGTLTVSSRWSEIEARIVIRITDTGTGMDTRTLQRLFEPYFSTRDAGTGLGLAIARRAVEEHGGTIGVTSNPGKGSTFDVILPTDPATQVDGQVVQ